MTPRTKIHKVIIGIEENLRLLKLEVEKPYLSASNILVIQLRLRILADQIPYKLTYPQ